MQYKCTKAYFPRLYMAHWIYGKFKIFDLIIPPSITITQVNALFRAQNYSILRYFQRTYCSKFSILFDPFDLNSLCSLGWMHFALSLHTVEN